MTQTEAPPLFPAERGSLFDPPQEYTDMLTAGRPVAEVTLWNGKPVWLVTGYNEVRTALKDPRFSSDMSWPNTPTVSRQQIELQLKDTFLRKDGEEHARVRRALAKEFTIPRMEALRPRIREIVDNTIDEMLAQEQPVDYASTFAQVVPSLVICQLLGVPFEDQGAFKEISQIAVNYGVEPEEVMAAMGRLQQMFARIVAEKEAQPGDDLISRMLAESDEVGFDRNEVIGISFILRGAGHETTANSIALATLALLMHPEQKQKLTENPDLIPQAVDELLRYITVVHHGITRVVTEDMELGGAQLKRGDGVITLINTANRDESRFSCPHALDVERPARGHVAFGFGPHQCLGAALARLEMEVVFERLLERVPTLHLAVPENQLLMRNDMFVYGVHELPVAW